MFSVEPDLFKVVMFLSGFYSQSIQSSGHPLPHTFSLSPTISVLTATVSSISVQSVVRGTAALGTSGRGEAKVGTVSIVV